MASGTGHNQPAPRLARNQNTPLKDLTLEWATGRSCTLSMACICGCLVELVQ